MLCVPGLGRGAITIADHSLCTNHHHLFMSLSAASSPRHILDKSPLDDPRLVNSVDHAQRFANQTISESPSSDDPIIDKDTFDQILELDEDDELEFSSSMVAQFCLQARNTIKEMQEAYEAASKTGGKDRDGLNRLSSRGHFLKGSSAAIGAKRVQELCERAQHYGICRDEEKNEDLSPQEALQRFDPLLKDLDREIAQSEKWLVAYYKGKGVVLDIEGASED